MSRIVLLLVALAVGGCVPAIIGVSAAAGGLAVGVTYEVKGEPPACDAGGE